MAALSVGQLLYKALKHLRPRVRNAVHRMTHTINQALLVKGLFIHHFFQISPHLLLICNISHMLLQIIHHFYHFNIRAAMLRPF